MEIDTHATGQTIVISLYPVLSHGMVEDKKKESWSCHFSPMRLITIICKKIVQRSEVQRSKV